VRTRAGIQHREDGATFVAAVGAELRRWDAHLERLQVKAATTERSARERAEAAISELRRHRTTLSQRLGEVRSASAEARSEGRKSVQAARDELKQRAAEVAARLERGGKA
jgi:uncharacterized coiled-coil DUF342 family protein